MNQGYQKFKLLCLTVAALSFLIGCASKDDRRVVAGVILNASTGDPVRNQQLVLDRPPGDYPGITMLAFGTPQQKTISTTTTDQNGFFRFSVDNHGDRFLYVLFGSKVPKGDYHIANKRDSAFPNDPKFKLQTDVIHSDGGGFESSMMP